MGSYSSDLISNSTFPKTMSKEKEKFWGNWFEFSIIKLQICAKVYIEYNIFIESNDLTLLPYSGQIRVFDGPFQRPQHYYIILIGVTVHWCWYYNFDYCISIRPMFEDSLWVSCSLPGPKWPRCKMCLSWCLPSCIWALMCWWW